MKNITIIFLLSFFTIASVFGVDIVQNHQSKYRIIIGKQCEPVEKRAAQDLQEYIQKSTGAKLPIESNDSKTIVHAIVVGDCPAAKAVGIDSSTMKPEGFVIKTIGENLYIVGRDTAESPRSEHWRNAPQTGTWFGVSRFLETYLDIRWFFPGENGEYVPSQATLALPQADIQDYPKMELRRIYGTTTGLPAQQKQEVIDWQKRLGNGWSQIWSGSHTWGQYFSKEKYYKDHPDYFALVNGRRLAYNNGYGLQMCTTNPKGLDEFAKEIVAEVKRTGRPDVMFSLSPNDSGNFCECKNCTALDVEKNPETGKPVLTDRMMTYCNEVAKRVKKILPNQTFGMYSYSYYMLPPRKTKVDPSVRIMHVLNDSGVLYYSSKQRDVYLNQMLLPWKKMVDKLYYYCGPEGMGNISLPCMQKESIKYLFADLHTAQISGMTNDMGKKIDAGGLNLYLYHKMAWNPNRDIEPIYTDAINKCYGEKVAPYVREYFDNLEKHMASYAENIKVDTALGAARRFPDLLIEVYPGLYEESMPSLKKAMAQSASKKQKIRLQMIVDNLDYCHDTVNLYQMAQKVLKESKKDKDDVLAGLALAEKRRVYLHHLIHEGRLTSGGYERTERNSLPFFNPIVWKGFLQQATGGVKKLGVTYLKKEDSPKIDGILNDPCWQNIKAFSANQDKNFGEQVSVKTDVKIAYDEKYFYLSVICEEPFMNKVRDSCKKHDGDVFEENDIELFFDPTNNRKDYKQVLVNSLGTVMDLDRVNGKNNIEWNSDTVVATQKNKNSWTLELRIPLKSLKSHELRLGEIWGFNICRVRKTVKNSQYTCWSTTFGNFGNPERFGKIFFK